MMKPSVSQLFALTTLLFAGGCVTPQKTTPPRSKANVQRVSPHGPEHRINALIQEAVHKIAQARDASLAHINSRSDILRQLSQIDPSTANAALAYQRLLPNLTQELSRYGFNVRSFEQGRQTDQFMTYSESDGTLKLGGSPGFTDAELIALYLLQIDSVTGILGSFNDRQHKVREFRVLPGDRYGSRYSDGELTIYWPATPKSLTTKSR